jgi:ankyrin repeat protein
MSAESFGRALRSSIFAAAVISSGAWAADPALITAAKNGQIAQIQSLLASGQSAAVTDSHGYTPLMYALSRADAGTITALLAHGGSIPADTPSFTPLIEAAKAGRTDIVQLLLGKNANVNALDDGGGTALIWAVGHGHGDTAAALLKAGADVNVRDGHGQTALISACQLGLAAMVTQLLAAPGLKIDNRDRLGYTALMWAAHNGRADIVQALLSHGADPKLKGKDGKTAADIAKARGYPVILQALSAN